MNIQLTFRSFRELEISLSRRIRKLQSLQEPLSRIVKDFFNEEKKWLDSEGEGSWVPLSPGYAAWKKQHYPGRRMLQRTGRMYDELTGRRSRVRVRRDGASIEVKNTYWVEHQLGIDVTRRIVISPRLRAKSGVWSKLVTEHLAAKIR